MCFRNVALLLCLTVLVTHPGLSTAVPNAFRPRVVLTTRQSAEDAEPVSSMEPAAPSIMPVSVTDDTTTATATPDSMTDDAPTASTDPALGDIATPSMMPPSETDDAVPPIESPDLQRDGDESTMPSAMPVPNTDEPVTPTATATSPEGDATAMPSEMPMSTSVEPTAAVSTPSGMDEDVEAPSAIPEPSTDNMRAPTVTPTADIDNMATSSAMPVPTMTVSVTDEPAVATGTPGAEMDNSAMPSATPLSMTDEPAEPTATLVSAMEASAIPMSASDEPTMATATPVLEIEESAVPSAMPVQVSNEPVMATASPVAEVVESGQPLAFMPMPSTAVPDETENPLPESSEVTTTPVAVDRKPITEGVDATEEPPMAESSPEFNPMTPSATPSPSPLRVSPPRGARGPVSVPEMTAQALPSESFEFDIEASPAESSGPLEEVLQTQLPTPTPSTSGTFNTNNTDNSVDGVSSEVCVDAAYLSQYASRDLVHVKHVSAHALCPSNSTLPCATADHLLRVDGRPMSYRNYCQRPDVECVGLTMEVNSVLSHIWDEVEHDNGVVLTMLDARHPEAIQRTLHKGIALRRRLLRALWQ